MMAVTEIRVNFQYYMTHEYSRTLADKFINLRTSDTMRRNIEDLGTQEYSKVGSSMPPSK